MPLVFKAAFCYNCNMKTDSVDVVYCDASFYQDKSKICVLAIVYGKEIHRIRAQAKNGTVGELLAIMMARKLYPDKLIINDCKAVVDMINLDKRASMKRMLGDGAMVDFLMDTVRSGGVLWARRCFDETARLTDRCTRRNMSGGFRDYLKRDGFKVKDCGF